MREKFEAYMRAEWPDLQLTRLADGQYLVGAVEIAWRTACALDVKP